MLKKIIPLLFLFLYLAGTAFSAEKVTVHFWQFWPEKWLQPELDRFEQETGISVQMERLTWSDGLNKIITSLAADQAPDIIEIGSTWVAGFGETGGLLPIEPGDLKEQLTMWKPTLIEGSPHAVPWTLSTGALFYNKELLQKAGITELPKNWDELLYDVKKIRDMAEDTYGFGIKTGSITTWQKFLPFVWSNGGAFLDESGENVLSTQKEFIEALTYYNHLRQFSLFDDNLAVRKAFQDGRIGFMMEEPGTIKRFRKESPNLDFGVMALPASPKGKSINFAGAQMLAITKNTKNKEAAEKLIRFLVQPEVTQAITHKITTLFPSHKGAVNDPFYTKEHPELLLFLDILQTATSPPAHPQWVDFQEVLSEQIERVLFGLSEIDAAMQQAKYDIEKLMEEAKFDKLSNLNRPKTATFPWSIFWWSLGLLVLACIAYLQFSNRGENPLKRAREARYNWNTFLFLSPWLTVFCVFSLYPIAHSVYMSFTRFKATSDLPPIWTGWKNYGELLSDQHFIDSIYNSFIFVFGTVPLTMVLAIILAVVLNRNIRFRTFYRVSYFMPVVTSIMVIATLFIGLLSPTGFINDVLSVFGVAGKHWLRDVNLALPSIMVMNIWASFGFYTLMLLAGLQNIPEEYYESSSLEGASSFRQFFTITLPLLKPTLLVATLMNTILAFQVFGEILVMTKGGPLRTTETSVYYLYNVAFHKQKMGYGSASAYYIFLILLIFTVSQYILVHKKSDKI